MTPRHLTCAAAAAGQLVTFADAPPPTVDVADRTITGLVVPFGQPGATGDGLLTFARGSIHWSPDVGRVKLLREHDQREPVGYALELVEDADGIHGTFAVPEGPEGDRVLADADNGLRDGFSVGVMLDGATHARLRRAQAGAAVAASGHLRETSVVTVPAFDDARVTRRHLVSASTGAHARGSARLTTMTAAAANVPNTPPAPAPATPPPSAPDPNADPTEPPASPTPTTPAPPTQASTPAHVRAAHAAALTVMSEPSTYTLNGSGHSLVRDAFAARVDGDTDAAARIRRFNAELTAGNLGSVVAFIRASADLTTAAGPIASPALTTDVDIPAVFLPQANRGDLLLRAVDLGRPITSRLNRIAITNAQPFLVPIEGEFTGVADHVEGTAHVPEGTLVLDDAPVMPKAMSGAYVLSRELVDATNPAIDQIAMRAMLRDYRRVSEGRVITTLLDADTTPVLSVNTAMELRAALIGMINDDDEGMDFVAVGRGMLGALYADVDTTGRPMLASGGTLPSATTGPRAGYTGLTVDGTDVIRASRLPAEVGLAVRSAGVLFVESNVQQFRFDEVMGPGLIKLALWAYVGVAVLEADAVAEITTAAA